MKTQILKALALTLCLATTLSAKADKELRGEEPTSSRSEINEAMDELDARGINLFSPYETCEIQILSHTTYSYRLFAQENIKRIRFIGPVVEFTVTEEVCRGENDCIKFLIDGELDLETRERKVKKVEITQDSLEDESLPANEDNRVEKKQSVNYSKPKPIRNVRPLVLQLGSEESYSASVVCTKSNGNDVTVAPR